MIQSLLTCPVKKASVKQITYLTPEDKKKEKPQLLVRMTLKDTQKLVLLVGRQSAGSQGQKEDCPPYTLANLMSYKPNTYSE